MFPRKEGKRRRQFCGRTASLAFRHIPPDTARIRYATDGALLSPSARALRMYYCTKKTVGGGGGGGGEGGGNTAPKHAREHEARPPQTQEEFRLDSNNFRFICDGVVSVDSYTETPYALSWQFSQTYGRITNNYGSSWRKDVVNQCLEFALRLLEFVVRSCVALARTFCQRTHATLHCIIATRTRGGGVIRIQPW